MESEMKRAAKGLEFERAAALRDELRDIRRRLLDEGEEIAIERRLNAAQAGVSEPNTRRVRAARPSEESPALGSAGDWLVGLRDEHPEEQQEQTESAATPDPAVVEKQRPRATWDPSITPNVISRKGERPRRRR